MQKLVNIDTPVLFIPNLAIHFTSSSEQNRFEFNNETNLRPIIATLATENLNKVNSILSFVILYRIKHMVLFWRDLDVFHSVVSKKLDW